MKKRLISLIAILLCFMYAQAQYQITAKLTGFKEGTKFYLKDNTADIVIDSALIKKGTVRMSGKFTGIKNLWFYTNADHNFYYTNLLIGSDRLQLEGDLKDFPRDLRITGSASQDVANILNEQTKDLWKKRDSVVSILMPLAMGEQSDSIRKITKPMSKQLKQIDSSMEVITQKFVAHHLNSYAALQELYYSRSKYPKAEFEKLFNQVKMPYLNGSFGNRIKTYIQVGDALKKGDLFYDFEAANIQGKKYKISDFKDKYILLDFTETYCGPCILAAESLKTIAGTYPNQLQVVTFYAESNPKVMQEGLNRDKFTWPTLWDGKGNFSEIVLKYGVEGFPSFILIDPQGKIVSRVTGFGKEDNGKGNIENEIAKIMEKTK